MFSFHQAEKPLELRIAPCSLHIRLHGVWGGGRPMKNQFHQVCIICAVLLVPYSSTYYHYAFIGTVIIPRPLIIAHGLVMLGAVQTYNNNGLSTKTVQI